MKQFKDLLSSAFQATWKTKLLTDWPAIMGNLASKVSLEKIYNDSLVLGVNDTNWLQELYLLSPVLIKTINAHIEKPYITSLRFQQGKTVAKKVIVPKPAPVEKPLKPLVLSGAEKTALTHVQDDELQQAIKAFLQRCQQEKS